MKHLYSTFKNTVTKISETAKTSLNKFTFTN